MHARRIVGAAIACVMVLVLVPGLIDPLEGGVALLLGGILAGLAWLIGRTPLPRLGWISWSAAVGVGVLAIAIAIATDPGTRAQEGLTGLPPILILLLAGYEAAVLLTIAGGVRYAIACIQGAREHDDRVEAAPTSGLR
jgi:uncharacterized membrane protein YjjP (DUF1212 family)